MAKTIESKQQNNLIISFDDRALSHGLQDNDAGEIQAFENSSE